jgi:D-glucosaminate-6-phosphate ammonia-lyase
MKRRNAIKGMAILPLTGGLLSTKSEASLLDRITDLTGNTPEESMAPGTSFMNENNIFRSIGVEPVINCMGAYTIIGGSIERPAVREAMDAAAHNFVQYDELASGIGQKLADLTGAEWGMVSAGCAAGLKHITAACVTGGNPEKLIRIPDLRGFDKTEVIIPRYSRTSYDHAIRNIGVTIVHVDSAEELEKAINPKTAMIYLMTSDTSATGQPLSLEVIARIAKPKNIPVLVDAAAESLTIPPVHLKRGATVVAYSGGKAMCGPQCAGLMLGDKAILMSAWQASSPHHGPGRDNKVGREEMIGMLAAVQDWKQRDHAAEWSRWLGWLKTIEKKVSVISGIRTRIVEPEDLNNKYPVLHVMWDSSQLNMTGMDIAEELGRNKPRVALGAKDEAGGASSVNITAGHMQAGEDKIVADRLYEVLSKKRGPKAVMAGPVANLTGRWDVDVKFLSSTSQHAFTLEQDGNWLSGTHRGDLDIRNVNGTIDGNQVRLKSSIPLVGDTINFLFSGTVTGDAFSGNIHLGEYLTATFKATRNKAKSVREKVVIPGGPPLAT